MNETKSKPSIIRSEAIRARGQTEVFIKGKVTTIIGLKKVNGQARLYVQIDPSTVDETNTKIGVISIEEGIIFNEPVNAIDTIDADSSNENLWSPVGSLDLGFQALHFFFIYSFETLDNRIKKTLEVLKEGNDAPKAPAKKTSKKGKK